MSATVTASYEKLAAFYLGKEFDLELGALRENLVLYDAKDLTTHAICVGMTGSGKTGLCLSLLEEAAIDGIPAIALDPKGDLGNLMLTFPDLAPEAFRPWIDEAEASRKGLTPQAFAADTAARWKQGLADWGQDGARIQRFRDAAEIAVYTPGSSAGLPITVLRSFDAPPPALLADGDAMRERVQAAVSGLLALLGIHADPVRSREHILLSNILDVAWRAGRNLDLPGLIRDIQTPPFDKVGVFDLESFFPNKDRFELAMSLNNLLASPGFSAWLEGEPLHIGNLLYTPAGKPRIAILSIAHLSDAERMFFVTILLNEVLAWTRTQSGTSSLRAILYMDEIFGYFPPTANPPSKLPMLTLLKQARAFGVGVVLATQNPVDLDYKGLSNTGTWFIGRLQTERDKLRVLDGLQGASASSGAAFDRGSMDRILSGLGSRVFLLHNVHEDHPVIFQTRWALSFLRGPLTRPQIETLMAPYKAARAAQSPTHAAEAEPTAPPDSHTSERPVVPSSIREYFLPREHAVGDGNRLVYRPAIVAACRLHYVRVSAKLDEYSDLTLLAPLPEGSPHVDWPQAETLPAHVEFDQPPPDPHARFADVPADGISPTKYNAWEKDLKSHLVQHREAAIYHCKELKTYSRLGETEGEFRGRIGHAVHEQRDLHVARLRKRYESKFAMLQDRIRRAQDRVEREQEQLGRQKMNTAISVGATLLGAVMGRKLTSARNIGRVSTAMRGAGRAGKEKMDIQRALAELDAQQQKLLDLEADFARDVDGLEASLDPTALELEPIHVRPRKSDISLRAFGLAWIPWRVTPEGIAEPLHAAP